MTKKMNDTVVLIGLAGAARCGKDTTAYTAMRIMADTISPEAYDWLISKESFASPIKSMVAMLLDYFGVAAITNHNAMNEYIDGEYKETVIPAIGKSPRDLLQTLGTDWGRKCVHEDLWINSMLERLPQYEEAAKHGHKGAVVFVTDVRFSNEADAIHSLGGIVVKVDHGDRVLDGVKRDHPSEAGLDDRYIDMTIDNSGTIEELEPKTVILLETIMKIAIASSTPEEISLPTE